MKTPYAKYWMSAELLHALAPEDDDAELRAWVSADLDEVLPAPQGPAPTGLDGGSSANGTIGATGVTGTTGVTGAPCLVQSPLPVPPSSNSPA